MKPKAVDGWNVGHMAGGLLLSAEGFTVQFTKSEVDKLIAIMNTDSDGKLRDNTGTVVTVHQEKDHIILTRVGDKDYPDGIILPLDAFSEFQDTIKEEQSHAYARDGARIIRTKIETDHKKIAKQQKVIRALTAARQIRRINT